mgnify:CR=1 FL=1
MRSKAPPAATIGAETDTLSFLPTSHAFLRASSRLFSNLLLASSSFAVSVPTFISPTCVLSCQCWIGRTDAVKESKKQEYTVNLLHLLWLIPVVVGIIVFTGVMIWVFWNLH